MGKLSCTSDYPSILGPCPTPYNSTGNYYSTFSENEEHSHLLVSPVLVASAVVGLVLLLSCITIIVGSLRRERQARLQWYHQERNRRRRRQRRQQRDEEYGFMSEGHIFGRRMRSMCGTLDEWPRNLELNSWGDVNPAIFHRMYPDSPPRYEDCVGPGATQLYIPTDAPPPYSVTDAYPPNGNLNPGAVEPGIPNPVVVQPGILNPGTVEPGILNPGAPVPGVLGAGGLEPGSGPGRPRDEQVHSISMDALPPYEVLVSSPRSSLLPLPGPGPMSPLDSPSLAPGGVTE